MEVIMYRMSFPRLITPIILLLDFFKESINKKYQMQDTLFIYFKWHIIKYCILLNYLPDLPLNLYKNYYLYNFNIEIGRRRLKC